MSGTKRCVTGALPKPITQSPAVARTVARLRAQGADGVILGWAREIARRGEASAAREPGAGDAARDIETWREGSARTIGMTPAGQFAALKYAPALEAEEAKF